MKNSNNFKTHLKVKSNIGLETDDKTGEANVIGLVYNLKCCSCALYSTTRHTLRSSKSVIIYLVICKIVMISNDI